MYTLLGCVVIVGVYALYRTYVPFGGRTSKKVTQRSSNYVGRRFVNQIPTDMSMSARDVISLLRDQLKASPSRKPVPPLTPVYPEKSQILTAAEPQITWFGHSAFLLQADGKNILLDPMLGDVASPFTRIGPKRFVDSLPVEIDDLPHIDAVVISHDHYDHLDYATIKKLRSKASMFFVPIGLAAHLRKWGVSQQQITELDWWQEVEYKGARLICTPARHFSGRTMTDRFATLWCSWVISTNSTQVYFSGDTGYGPHFKEIGKRYGPFDLTLLECGQYDSRWAAIHMLPEQTVAAHIDLHGTRMIPIHWGAFALALHDWTEPVERALAEGAKTKSEILTPQIGEIVRYQSKKYPQTKWWR